MRGGALPPALLCAALGFALSFGRKDSLPYALVILIISAGGASFLTYPVVWQDGVFLGLWGSIILAALSVHLPKQLGFKSTLLLALNSGFWVGSVIAISGGKIDLLKSLPFVLLCLPGAWVVSMGWGLGIKVVASWLIAVSILAAALPLTPTPGYKPDHMD